MNIPKNKGFTLLEMTMVLVIIGVVVGGILLGQSIIASARLQKMITDVNTYATAVNNFKQSYQMLPGDFTNAVSIWGAAGGGSGDNYTSSCANTAGSGTATCNGNGDGQVAPSGTYSYEQYRFWQHLSNAGLVNNNFNGYMASGYLPNSPGVNVPEDFLSHQCYLSAGWVGTQSGSANYFNGTYDNVFTVSNATLTEAQLIDTKMDDGMPGTGTVRSYPSGSSLLGNCSTCISGTTSTTATYISTGAANQITFLPFMFVMGF